MKNSKENVKKIKAPKFGVLDAVIILLVIVIVLSVYFRYNIVQWLSNSNDIKEYMISYTIDDVRYTTPNYINIGDKVYFADSGDEFGTLVNVSENMGALSITPASEFFTDSKGNIVEVFYPNSETRVSAIGKMVCNGRYSDDGSFLVNGSTFVASGQYIKINTPYTTVTIRIDGITPVTEG